MAIESVSVAFQVMVVGDSESSYGPPLDKREDAEAVAAHLKIGYSSRVKRLYAVVGVTLQRYAAQIDAGSRIVLFKAGVIGEEDL